MFSFLKKSTVLPIKPLLTLLDLKNELKSMAAYIKATKKEVKLGSPALNKESEESIKTFQAYWQEVSKLATTRKRFRCYLIAYCELRGMPRERVEKPAKNNPPNEDFIKEAKLAYMPVWREHDYVCARQA